VLRRRDWLMIHERIAQGVYVKDIAGEMGGSSACGESRVAAGRSTAGPAAGSAQEQA